jgi:uncharacterized repeat protein (TIGR03803 family)
MSRAHTLAANTASSPAEQLLKVACLILTCFILALAGPLPSALADSRVVYNFTLPGGSNPDCPFTPGPDGDYYATNAIGGAGGTGAIIQLNPITGTVADVHDFAQISNPSNETNNGGANPDRGLCLYGGALYGVTYSGGTTVKNSESNGTLFQYVPGNPGTVSTLLTFSASEGEGHPGAVTAGNDSYLYGTLANQNKPWCTGMIYRVAPGAPMSILHVFSPTGLEGIGPNQLTLYPDGTLFGTCIYGGFYGYGTLFSMNRDGSSFRVLHSFNAPDGIYPNTQLVVSNTPGHLYGMTSAGGVDGYGTIFDATVSGVVTTLHMFDGYDGLTPNYLGYGPDGQTLFGTAEYGGYSDQGVVFQFDPTNPTTFPGAISMSSQLGSSPEGLAFVRTESGTEMVLNCINKGPFGAGSVIAINAQSQISVITSFSAPDGLNPESSLLLGKDPATGASALFGTAISGGENYTGAVFEASETEDPHKDAMSSVSSLFSFGPYGQSEVLETGAYPSQALTQDPNTLDLYGTTEFGGQYGTGVAYKLSYDSSSSSWNQTVLHNFGSVGTANADGAYPHCSLLCLTGWSGSILVGTSLNGGGYNGGTIYTMASDGSGFTPLYWFTGGADGSEPSGLIYDGRYFYGTCQGGGEYGFGTVFAFDPSTGTVYTLHSFDFLDGASSIAPLTEAPGSDSEPGPILYGTTQYGGSSGLGTVFGYDLSAGLFSNITSFGTSSYEGYKPGASLLYIPTASGLSGANSNSRGGFVVGSTSRGNSAKLKAPGGTLFSLATSSLQSAAPTAITNFTGPNGSVPGGQEIAGDDGYYYSTTEYGGAGESLYLNSAGWGTIVQTAYPVAQAVLPATGSVKTKLQLSIFGSGFTVNSQVIWNGKTKLKANRVSSQELTVTIPAAMNKTTGSIPIQVYDPVPAPTGTTSQSVIETVS